MSYGKENYWLTKEKWVCTNHLPTLKLMPHMGECYLCGAKRPKFFRAKMVDGVIDFNEKVESIRKNGSPLCDYVKCKRGVNGSRGLAKGKSKYCNPECRKQKAREKYIAKKALENGHTKKNSKRNTG